MTRIASEAGKVDEKAEAWLVASFTFLKARQVFTDRDMRTAYRAGFAGGLEHARKVFTAPAKDKPECDYCGATEGLRVMNIGYGARGPHCSCEACFTGTDTGPSFDDLPTVEEAQS